MIDGIDDDTPIMVRGQSLTFTYEWIIDNWLPFQKYHQTGEKLASMPFSVLNNSWCLHIYPRGVNEESEDYVSLILKRLSKSNVPVCARLEFFLKYTGKDNTDLFISKYSVKKCTFDLQTQTTGAFKLASKDAIANYARHAMSANKLTVVCEISAEQEGLPDTWKCENDMERHLNALEKFVDNEHLSDVKFMVKDKHIHAHKMLLSAHSPVFAAMFQHEMLENTEDIVTIEDISYEVFIELLRFVYTGKRVFNENASVSDLLKAADKYQLEELKSACEEHLCATTNIHNVVDHLSLADLHNAVNLKNVALDFIVGHGKEMIDKPEIEALKNVNTALFNDVLRFIFARVK